MGGDIPQALLEVGQGRGPDGRRRERREAHLAQGDDHGDERHAVDGEAPGRTEEAVDQPPGRGADGHGRVEHGRVQGDGVGHVLPPDHLQDEGLPGRGLEGVGRAEENGDDEDVPGLDPVQEGQGGDGERQQHHRRLGDDEQGPARHPVRDDPRVEHEQPGRGPGREADEAEVGRGLGQVEDEEAQGRRFHPGPEHREHLAPEPEPVVGIFEGRERLGPAQLHRTSSSAGVQAGSTMQRKASRPAARVLDELDRSRGNVHGLPRRDLGRLFADVHQAPALEDVIDLGGLQPVGEGAPAGADLGPGQTVADGRGSLATASGALGGRRSLPPRSRPCSRAI